MLILSLHYFSVIPLREITSLEMYSKLFRKKLLSKRKNQFSCIKSNGIKWIPTVSCCFLVYTDIKSHKTRTNEQASGQAHFMVANRCTSNTHTYTEPLWGKWLTTKGKQTGCSNRHEYFSIAKLWKWKCMSEWERASKWEWKHSTRDRERERDVLPLIHLMQNIKIQVETSNVPAS